MHFQSHLSVVAATATLCAAMFAEEARADTAFTYQGELKQNGDLASGTYDMDFSLWSAASDGSQIGATISLEDVPVADGRFTVELDYGADAFSSSSRFLEIVVEGFTLSPRNRIMPSPFAVQTRGVFVNEQQLIGIGTTAPSADARLTVVANGQFQAIQARSGAAAWPTIYGFNGNTLGHVLHADGIADAKLDQGGVVIVGQINGENLAIDGNEIMARSNSAESTLHLNLEGGHIVTGGRLGVGMNPGFAQLSVEDSDPTTAFGLSVETSNQNGLPSIYAENLAGGPVLWALGSSDISLGGGGLIVAGHEQSENVAIDNNEIMARNNGQPAPLHLNLEGGQIFMGEYAIKPPYAYGRIDENGTLISGSSNIVNTVAVDNDLYVEFTESFLDTDIVILTDADASDEAMRLTYKRSGQALQINAYGDVNGWIIEEVAFVVFRP